MEKMDRIYKLKIAKLNDQISVAYQIEIADIKQIKELGFSSIISNRPDGEIEEMPDFDEIEEVANKENIKCYYIPVAGRNAIGEKMIAKTKTVLKSAKEPILAYCQTGTRCTILWALAQKGKMSADEIINAALRAGYDIAYLKDQLI